MQELLLENVFVTRFTDAAELLAKVKLCLELEPLREKIMRIGCKRSLQLQYRHEFGKLL